MNLFMFKPKVIGVGGIFLKPKNQVVFANGTKTIWVLILILTVPHLSFEMQITLKRFSIFYGLFSKVIQITFRPQPKSLWLIFEWKTSKKRYRTCEKLEQKSSMKSQLPPMGNLCTYWILRGMQSNYGKPMMTFLVIWWGQQTNKKAGHKPDSVVPYHWSRPNITAGLYPPTHQLKSASFKHWFTWRFTV